MKFEILRGSDGRRWIRFDGSGLAVELRAGDPPAKVKGKRK